MSPVTAGASEFAKIFPQPDDMADNVAMVIDAAATGVGLWIKLRRPRTRASARRSLSFGSAYMSVSRRALPAGKLRPLVLDRLDWQKKAASISAGRELSGF